MSTIEALSDPVLRPIRHFEGARAALAPRDRQKELVRRAHTFREELLSGPQVLYYRTFPLISVPYPTKYAFSGAASAPTPLVHLLNRLIVVQFKSDAGVKTLLIGPSDHARNKHTPFFEHLGQGVRRLGRVGERVLAPVHGTVEDALARTGLLPEDVDYVSFDHLHTQDLRRWLGTRDEPAYFPRAKLIVTRQEWASAQGLLPLQAQWYCPQGCDGIDPERLLLIDGDVRLGEGVALVRTPGHTEGNHSFVVHTSDGLLVTSENGVCPDSYSPLNSAIPGVRRFARRTGAEVILNGNTLEGSVDQYLSMIVERTIAGRSPRNPEFFNVVCSSEATSYWLFPGVRPTWSTGELEFGRPVRAGVAV
ncbi:MAG: hypothetical protein M9894_21370 [Planctomycetes bacterium]|nr:hypothetical protein [Planctomycetota bacterium]